jgi:hypothetical protein
MANALAPALELDAEEVADAPLLGYWIERQGNQWSDRPEPTPQRWIENANNHITINIESFRQGRPLDRLLVDARTFKIPSLVEALVDFEQRWAVTAELLGRIPASSPGEALFIDGGDAEALVWRDGIVIGAREPLATTLRLLTKNFSKEARENYVYASPASLKSALELLPDAVKSTYVLDAESFYTEACHELAVERQKKLKRMAPTSEWGPDGRPTEGDPFGGPVAMRPGVGGSWSTVGRTRSG